MVAAAIQIFDIFTHDNVNYGKALDSLFLFAAGRPLDRELLMEWRASMESLSPSTVNVRLSAVRKMIGEARRNGLLSVTDAANLADLPNHRQQGTRLGNWLTRDQAKELLTVSRVALGSGAPSVLHLKM